MLESAATDEKNEESDRAKLGDRLKAFHKGKEQEDETTCLMEEMRKMWRLLNTKVLRRSKVCAVLREYVDTFDRDRGRPKTIMTKLRQSMQSRETKNLNLVEDLEDILSKMKQMGGGCRGQGRKTVETG